MDVERLDEWLERIIAVLIGGAISVAILFFGGVRLHEFLVTEALVGLALVFWLLRIWVVRSHRLLWPPVCWGVLLFAGWAIWRASVADIEYIARDELMRVLCYVALFFITVNNLNRQGTAQGLAWWITGLATALCFYGAWQFATNSNTVWGLERGEDYLRRASGSYGNPNHFAGLLELLLPLAIVTVIAGRIKAVGRVVLAYAALVMLTGLGLTFSRGGFIAAGVGLAFVLIALARNRDYRWFALISLAVILIAGAGLTLRSRTLQKRIEASYDFDPGSRNSRLHIWRATIAMWRDHPWFGVGPGHFSERFKQYRTWWAHGEPIRAHNDYLNSLADWGIAGTAVAGLPWLLLGYGVARTLKQVRRDPGDLEVKRSSRYSFVLGVTGGLIALLVHSVTDFNMHIPANAMVAVAWMALLAGYSRYATDDWWTSSRRPWRILLTLIVILPLLAAFAWDLGRRGRESYHLRRAHAAMPLSDRQLDEFKAAWTIEPHNPETAGLIGEFFRRKSFLGFPGYEAVARESIEWFNSAAKLNPYNPVFRYSVGMCLDWLGEHDRATDAFNAALKLDPDGRITNYYMGWHEEQVGNAPQARDWYTKAIERGWPIFQPAMDALNRLNQRFPPPPAPAPVPPAAEQ